MLAFLAQVEVQVEVGMGMEDRNPYREEGRSRRI